MGRHWRTGDGRELALIHHQLWRDFLHPASILVCVWLDTYCDVHTGTSASTRAHRLPDQDDKSPPARQVSICELSAACCGVHTSVITTSLWPALNVAPFNPWISNLSTKATACILSVCCINNRWHSGSVDICSYNKSFTSVVREFLRRHQVFQVLKPSPF